MDKKRKLIEAVCKTCGMTFHGRADRIRSGLTKYCSRKCSAIAGSKVQKKKHCFKGSNNPNWKGEKRISKYEFKCRYKLRNPEKARARELLYAGIRSGHIQRQPCKLCGVNEVHGHHEDYSKPYDVTWLCPKHHREIHKDYAVIACNI